MKKIFVVGTGRCGTVTFNKLLNSLPNTFSMHEGIFYVDDKRTRLTDFKDINRKIYFQSKNPQKELNNIKKFRGNIAKQIDEEFRTRKKLIRDLERKNINFCDVNPYQYPLIDYLHHKYPEAKFVHLIRNGYDVVKSYYQRENTTYPDNILEKNYSGYRSGKPIPLDGERWKSSWKNFDRVQKITWFWCKVNNIIDNKLNKIPNGQKTLFKLEDLNDENFTELLNFLELPIKYDKALMKTHNSTKNTLEWSKDRIGKFNNIASSTMNKFGYGIIK